MITELTRSLTNEAGQENGGFASKLREFAGIFEVSSETQVYEYFKQIWL